MERLVGTMERFWSSEDLLPSNEASNSLSKEFVDEVD